MRIKRKLLSFFISLSLIFEQTSFAQAAKTLDISGYFNQARNAVISQDKFRPLHLRYISYDSYNNDFKLLLDKGDYFKSQVTGHPSTTLGASKSQVKEEDVFKETTQELMRYFFIGLSLPNDKFWVNLRPDSPDNIIDDDLAKTDIGRILLEADVQLKKDTAGFTSPQTPEGKDYWDKLYKKAEELFGTENITIPTLTRPWIVPNEIIIREFAGEAGDTERAQASRSTPNAYIYKATLKVMLEEDYLRGTKDEGRGTIANYSFNDPRLKELNEYSTKLIRETIIPKLTYQVNTSKRYAPLRQVYYSLILAQWFKERFSKDRDGSFKGNALLKNRPLRGRTVPTIVQLIDSGNLTSNLQPLPPKADLPAAETSHFSLLSQSPYSKEVYFHQYQKSFKDGEYNITEPVYTPYGQNIRRYMSGGIVGFMSSSPVTTTISAKKDRVIEISDEFTLPIHYVDSEKQLWVKIEEGLKTIKGGDGERKYYIDVQRKLHDDVIFNEIEQSTLLVRVKDNHQGYDLVKIGQMFFIDKEVYKDLEEYEELRIALKERVILVPDLSQSTIGESEESGGRMKLFTSATILLILNSNIAGKCVIDAGSGDGLLALTALKRGASQAILIDSDKTSLNKAKQNLEANNFREGEHFWCIARDLTKKDAVIPKIPVIKNSVVLISNIGTWPSDYKDVTNLTSVELILNVVREHNIKIDEIILGGYQSKEYIEHLPDGDIAELKKYGFQQRPERSQVGGCVSISVVSSSVEADEESSLIPSTNDDSVNRRYDEFWEIVDTADSKAAKRNVAGSVEKAIDVLFDRISEIKVAEAIVRISLLDIPRSSYSYLKLIDEHYGEFKAMSILAEIISKITTDDTRLNIVRQIIGKNNDMAFADEMITALGGQNVVAAFLDSPIAFCLIWENSARIKELLDKAENNVATLDNLFQISVENLGNNKFFRYFLTLLIRSHPRYYDKFIMFLKKQNNGETTIGRIKQEFKSQDAGSYRILSPFASIEEIKHLIGGEIVDIRGDKFYTEEREVSIKYYPLYYNQISKETKAIIIQYNLLKDLISICYYNQNGIIKVITGGNEVEENLRIIGLIGGNGIVAITRGDEDGVPIDFMPSIHIDMHSHPDAPVMPTDDDKVYARKLFNFPVSTNETEEKRKNHSWVDHQVIRGLEEFVYPNNEVKQRVIDFLMERVNKGSIPRILMVGIGRGALPFDLLRTLGSDSEKRIKIDSINLEDSSMLFTLDELIDGYSDYRIPREQIEKYRKHVEDGYMSYDLRKGLPEALGKYDLILVPNEVLKYIPDCLLKVVAPLVNNMLSDDGELFAVVRKVALKGYKDGIGIRDLLNKLPEWQAFPDYDHEAMEERRVTADNLADEFMVHAKKSSRTVDLRNYLTYEEITNVENYAYPPSIYYPRESGEAKNSSPLNENNKDLGGIDLRALPISTKAVSGIDSSFFGSSPISLNINFDEECRQVEVMLKNDFIPSAARIRDMAYAASQSSAVSSEQLEVVITHIAQILRAQEQKLIPTEPALKQILLELESDKPAREMQLALSQIAI